MVFSFLPCPLSNLVVNWKMQEGGIFMDVHEMKSQKISLGYSCEMISRFSGVPLETVQKIFEDDEPLRTFGTWRALSDFFETPASDDRVSENTPVYGRKRQGEYTLEDYYAIPDGIRVELIDGVIYDFFGAPTLIHQSIIGVIYAKLLAHVTAHRGQCMTFFSPINVQLDCDDKTMLQPDLVIVCDRDKFNRRCIYGAPDFVIEVLSPSTRRKDMVTKLDKYMAAGVREYWMIDPKKKTVIVYDFEHDQFPMIFGFQDKVPVHMWDGECVIDFQEVYEHIRFFYEREEAPE